MKVLSQSNIAGIQASCVIFETPITIYKPDILETAYGEGFNELMNTFFAHKYGEINKYIDRLDIDSLDTIDVFLELGINIPQSYIADNHKLDVSTIRRFISESLFIVSGNKFRQNYYYPIFSFINKYPIVRNTDESDSTRMIFDVEELLGSILDEIFIALTNINLDIHILSDKRKLFSYCLYYIVNAKIKEDNEWKLFQNV